MEEQMKKRGVPPLLRGLLFLLLLAGIAAVLLAVLSGMDAGSLGKTGLSELLERAGKAFEEEMPSQQAIVALSAEEPLPAMSVQGENLVLCSNGELRCLDSEGLERWIKPVQLQTPFVTADGRDVLYADLTGGTYGVVRDGAAFFEKTGEERIFNASMSRDYILLLLKSADSGYSAVLEGLSREGAPVFKSFLTEYTPFLVRQNPDSGQDSVILSGISATRLEAGAVVEFLAPDMTRLGGVSAEDDLYPVILQMNDGTTCLAGEKSLRLVDRDLAVVGEYRPEGDDITAAALLDGTYPVVAVLDGKRFETTRQEKTWVRMLNRDGTLLRESVQDGRVIRMLSGPGCIALQMETRVVFLNADGSELLSFDARNSVQDVVLTEKGIAYVMADSQVTTLRLKVRKKFLGIF